MSKETISIIISSKNEEGTIGEVIARCKKYATEMLIIDGHSTDRTREISQSLGAAVYLDGAKGKGQAVRLGIEKAKGDILVFIDADGSHEPDDIPKLIQPILENKADIVIGSRSKGGSDEISGDLNKFIRTTGGNIIGLGINYRFGVRLTDCQNGFRAIRRQVALALKLKENITTIEQEMVMKALRKGFRISEIPSHEYERRCGDSKYKLRNVWCRFLYSWIRYMFWDDA